MHEFVEGLFDSIAELGRTTKICFACIMAWLDFGLLRKLSVQKGISTTNVQYHFSKTFFFPPFDEIEWPGYKTFYAKATMYAIQNWSDGWDQQPWSKQEISGFHRLGCTGYEHVSRLDTEDPRYDICWDDSE